MHRWRVWSAQKEAARVQGLFAGNVPQNFFPVPPEGADSDSDQDDDPLSQTSESVGVAAAGAGVAVAKKPLGGTLRSVASRCASAATSALRLGSPVPHLRRDWAHPLPHLRRD